MSKGNFQATIETLAHDDIKEVSRNESKSNLHAIRENNARRKLENVLFDRFWYQNREENQRRVRMSKQREIEENIKKSKEIQATRGEQNDSGVIYSDQKRHENNPA